MLTVKMNKMKTPNHQTSIGVDTTVSNKRNICIKPPNGTKCQRERPINDYDTTSTKEKFNFIAFFGKFLGWECKYEWKTNPRYWLTVIDILFMWYHIIHSQVEHFIDGSYGRIFEIFACYGISASVSSNSMLSWGKT